MRPSGDTLRLLEEELLACSAAAAGNGLSLTVHRSVHVFTQGSPTDACAVRTANTLGSPAIAVVARCLRLFCGPFRRSRQWPSLSAAGHECSHYRRRARPEKSGAEGGAADSARPCWTAAPVNLHAPSVRPVPFISARYRRPSLQVRLPGH